MVFQWREVYGPEEGFYEEYCAGFYDEYCAGFYDEYCAGYILVKTNFHIIMWSGIYLEVSL